MLHSADRGRANWRRLGAASALVALAATYGFFVHRNHIFPYGLARRALTVLRSSSTGDRVDLARRGDALNSLEAVDRLARIPYLQGYRPATGRGGVRVYDRALAQDGLNLYTSGRSSVATLMDMDGTVLKTWTVDAVRAFPGIVQPDNQHQRGRFLRCAHLLPDGGLLAMLSRTGLVRFDASSHVLWTYPADVHHDLTVDASGHVWVLTRGDRLVPQLRADVPVWDNSLVELSPDGRELRSISLLDALRSSDYAPLLARTPFDTDILHTNSVRVLDGSLASRLPAFRKGNLLLSIRHLDAIVVLDPQAGRIVWSLTGKWRVQHSAWLLPTGRLLLFDNLGMMRAASRALEVDPFTQETLWSYGDRLGEELLSEVEGAVQRLANGNTLVIESTFGRALEVTPERKVVWEFVNPNRSGARSDFVAALHGMNRVPRSVPLKAP